MSETSYSLLLRNLSNDYYYDRVGFEEYRRQRKQILDKIDEEMNGKQAVKSDQDDSSENAQFMQTIGFFKNANIDK